MLLNLIALTCLVALVGADDTAAELLKHHALDEGFDVSHPFLNTLFNLHDFDGDGHIAISQVVVMLVPTLHMSDGYELDTETAAAKALWEAKLEKIDSDSDGFLTLAEFRAIAEAPSQHVEDLRQAYVDGRLHDVVTAKEAKTPRKTSFNMFDGNMDGRLTEEEIAEIYIEAAVNSGADRDREIQALSSMFQKSDSNHDGFLNMAEFKHSLLAAANGVGPAIDRHQ